jgi:ABC-type dipeptide/oligopeptide/nickel transport system permease subunit
MIASSVSVLGGAGAYSSYTNLGYIPGSTLGLLGLAVSPKEILPYSLDGNNVWAGAPLNRIATVKDFSAVIVLTNDSVTARMWIEQIGPVLRQSATPLLIITSTQAEPLILPYYLAIPSQVQGLITGIVGGMAYARTVGNIQQSGLQDALSIGVIVSVLIIIVGTTIGLILKMRPPADKKES